MEYRAYDELMSYFQFEYNVYLVLVLIVAMGVIKAFVRYRQIGKSNNGEILPFEAKVFDLLISITAILGLVSANFFQGVIADIALESGLAWMSKTMYLLIASIILFNLQVFFIVLRDGKVRRMRQ